MDSIQGLPKHHLLQEEAEIEMSSESSQSTNAQSIKTGDQQIGKSAGEYVSPSPNGDDHQQGGDNNSQLTLTIKKLSGEPVNIPYSDNLKQMSIAGLKQLAFPNEVANGFSIRFIYRGRIIREEEVLGNLEFIGHPVIHAQVNPPLNAPAAANQQQGGDIENQQQQYQGVIPGNQYNNFQALAAQFIQQQQQQNANQQQQQQQQQQVVMQPLALEGTFCDFLFGFFLVLFLDYVGLFVAFCCQYTRKTKQGAIAGFCLKIIFTIIFFKEENVPDSQY